MKSRNSPRRIACVISAHGFGHAARSAAIMEALAALVPVHYEIITLVPAWFFRESLSCSFSYHPLVTDVGLAQLSALQADGPATLERLAAFYPLRPQAVAQMAQLIAGCDLVLADIAPLGLAAAKAAQIPAVLVENFTWDWIYRGYGANWPGLSFYSDYLHSLYHLADYRIQTAPVCCATPCQLRTPPVSRKVKNHPAQIRSQLGIPAGAKVILVTMGGIDGDSFPLEPLRQHEEVIFVLPGRAEQFTPEHNLRLLPKNSGIYHPDLVNAADVVIGKTGYSTLAEVYQAAIPWGFLSREDFAESGPLADFIGREMSGLELRSADFRSARWVDQLPALLQLPRKPHPQSNGADTAARFLTTLLS